MSDIDIITVRWDAERDVYKVNRPNWSGGEVVLWSAVKTMLASQAAEVARLTKENDWLRAYTGQSAKACVYCGLGADEMGKCERGFPGCARADDQMLCREVGVAIERDALQAEVARLTDVLRRGGFVKCDIPACNCGDWHHRYGLPERWAEITQALIDADVLGNSTGNKPLNAIKRLADERDALLARVEAAARSASFRVVIPARIASQRLHEKVLADVAGKPLVVRTWERACLSDASEVIVATDDIRVADAVEAHGAQAVLTDAHPTGTDRVAQVASLRVWQPADIVVNVQGDEPLISPADINAVAALLMRSPDAGMATLHVPLQRHERDTASVVKVVGGAGRAYWFSRARMPGAYRHLGLYAWRVDGLRWFSQLPRSFYERVEMLEQLRVLENGMTVALAEAPDGLSIAVDTAEDLARVRAIVEGRS